MSLIRYPRNLPARALNIEGDKLLVDNGFGLVRVFRKMKKKKNLKLGK